MKQTSSSKRLREATSRLVPRECEPSENPFPSRRIFQNATSIREITLNNVKPQASAPKKFGPDTPVLERGKDAISLEIDTDIVDAALMEDDVAKRLDGVSLFVTNLQRQTDDRQPKLKVVLEGIVDTLADAKLVLESQNEKIQQIEQENEELANEVKLLKKKVSKQKEEITKKSDQLHRFVRLCREMQLSIMNFIGIEPTEMENDGRE